MAISLRLSPARTVTSSPVPAPVPVPVPTAVVAGAAVGVAVTASTEAGAATLSAARKAWSMAGCTMVPEPVPKSDPVPVPVPDPASVPPVVGTGPVSPLASAGISSFQPGWITPSAWKTRPSASIVRPSLSRAISFQRVPLPRWASAIDQSDSAGRLSFTL